MKRQLKLVAGLMGVLQCVPIGFIYLRKERAAHSAAAGSNGQSNGHANGHSNGHANGHSNGHSNGHGKKVQ